MKKSKQSKTVLKQKYKTQELESLDCPPGTDPRVWGNPHRFTGKFIETTCSIMSQEALFLKIKYLEKEWLKKVKEHEAFMKVQYKRAKEAKTVKELLKEGCFFDKSETRDWFY